MTTWKTETEIHNCTKLYFPVYDYTFVQTSLLLVYFTLHQVSFIRSTGLVASITFLSKSDASTINTDSSNCCLDFEAA